MDKYFLKKAFLIENQIKSHHISFTSFKINETVEIFFT